MAGDHVMQRLSSAPFEVVGRFADASNATLLARLLDRGDQPLPADVTLDDLDPVDLAVYKPRRGEAPLWDFPDGSLHLHEVAAHRLSSVLGWDLVPTTALRADGPFGAGSLQRYVAHDPAEHYFTLRDVDDPDVRRQLHAMVLFDLLVNNADRKGGHVLREAGSEPPRIQVIDHGVCFHAEPHLRTVAWDFALQPIPAPLQADVACLGEWLASDGEAAMDGLLGVAELTALRQRATNVAGLRTFPEPVGPRPFPWPLL